MLATKNTGALPGTQEKNRPRPLSIQIRQNVRIEDRTDTALGPSDAKYQETEKYFAALLGDMDWTIARILDEHFSPHEAKKFTPTHESPWAEWQVQDTRTFEKLLQTRFRGVKPTLSMKMTLLYHGFAVAPQKIGPVQDVVPQDYQHLIERENRVIQDPLTFLEGYTERTWGETPPQLRLSSYPRRVPLVTEAMMSLRGGALDDAEMEDITSDEDLLADTKTAGHRKSNTGRVLPTSLFAHPRWNPYAEEKKAMEKKTMMYNSQAEFRTGSGTHESMRKQAWWAPPSIFANPLKPVMPLHAAPLETVIRTGPSVPSVSLGLRTSTEIARLEREVHMLRGHLLDRNRECPYHDCPRFFHYLDTKAFEDHLTQEHAIVRCTLCLAFPPAKKHTGMLYLDRSHIIEHIVGEHSEQLTRLISVPVSRHAMPSREPTSTGLAGPVGLPASVTARLGHPFCGRCGRDNTKCCESEDLKNHMFRCALPHWSLADGSSTAYCESCGTKTGWPNRSCPDKKCASHNPNLPDQERFCHKCGLRWNDNHCAAYKAKHESGCSLMGGANDSFCMYCGVSLRGLDTHGVQNHGQVCMARTEPSSRHIDEQNSLSGKYAEIYGGDNVRDTIETWDSSHDQGSHFEPEPDLHCSRCFLQAKDCEKPELHANKDLSCNIHWAKGSAENLPNVSGWVSRGDLEARGSTADEVLRQSAQDFVSKYPDYIPTISDAYLPQTSTKGGSSNLVVASSNSSKDPNIEMLTDKLTTKYPWPPSNKRPIIGLQSHKRPFKKQRHFSEPSSSEVSFDGDEASLTDSDDVGEEVPTARHPRKVLFPKYFGTSVKPSGEAVGTHAEKQVQTTNASAHQASQPPASRQASAVPVATVAQPRRSATPATRQAPGARQKPATPAATTAKAADSGTAQTKGAAASYPWPGPKAQILDKPASRLVEVTVGGPSGWGDNPAMATPSAASVRASSAPAAEEAQVSRPAAAAAAPQQAPATTRSGRTVRKTRAAADLQDEKSAGKPSHDGRNDNGKAAAVHTPAVKKGRPRK